MKDLHERLVLGIETSCDETAVALVTSRKRILAQRILSQMEEHAAYGGVVPEIAARSHMLHIERLLGETLGQASIALEDIDAVAVTAGPGLIGGVIVGVMTAKALASIYGKPIYGVNHLEGHALSVRLTEDVEFPFLLLLVSGGHCQILNVAGVGAYEKYGATRDDALGEAFDKVAKMLGLGYPGGPRVERLATAGDPARFDFPKPLHGQAGCDFSFSGLKTAVRREILSLHEKGALDAPAKADLCASFQAVVAEILRDRVGNAIARFRRQEGDGKTLVVAGGVAANTVLRRSLAAIAGENGMTLKAPPIALCTDNAAMIAWAALERIGAEFAADALDLAPRARWPIAG